MLRLFWNAGADEKPGIFLFGLKFTQLSILPGSVKWVPAYMDCFEAAARGTYICFQSAGGKLIIVKRLWACCMEEALYKFTLPLFLHVIK